MNKWIGTGRLTQDPELRNTQNGKSVCNFTVAVDRKFKTDGQPSADFINCIAWGKTGEFVSKYFTKGKLICVEGTMQTRNWEDQEKKKHYATEIIVDNVEFCGDKSSETKPSVSSVTKNKPNKIDIAYEGDGDLEEELPF